jgi:hypothetical protein
MKDLDRKIREALQREDAELAREFESEPSVFATLAETFRGRNRWLNVWGAVWMLVFLGVGVFAGVQFFQAETTRDQLLWATTTMLCTVITAMIKVWYWMEMQRNALTREVKRLELQVAHLAGRLRT